MLNKSNKNLDLFKIAESILKLEHCFLSNAKSLVILRFKKIKKYGNKY